MDLLIKLLVAIGIIWLVQTVLDVFELKQPANKIIFGISIILVIIWLISGQTVFIK